MSEKEVSVDEFIEWYTNFLLVRGIVAAAVFLPLVVYALYQAFSLL